jgi:hypothetical protein
VGTGDGVIERVAERLLDLDARDETGDVRVHSRPITLPRAVDAYTHPFATAGWNATGSPR